MLFRISSSQEHQKSLFVLTIQEAPLKKEVIQGVEARAETVVRRRDFLKTIMVVSIFMAVVVRHVFLVPLESL